mgnify:CR=1 FL=1
MPYDQSKPEIAAAYEAYQNILEQKPSFFNLYEHPDALEAYVNYHRTLENDGQIYVQTVEIIFPPQLAKQCPYGAIVIPTGRVLKWLANDLESIAEHEQARLYRETVIPFYPDPDDEDYDDGYENDDDDEKDDDYDHGDMSDLEEAFRMLDLDLAIKANIQKNGVKLDTDK